MDIKVIYVNADGLNQEHSEATDSIKMASFKTANYELNDAKLGRLVDGADAADEHIHDGRYFREDEHVAVSAGVTDAGKPIILDANGLIDSSLLGALDYANRNLDNLTEPTAIPAAVSLTSLGTSQTFGTEFEHKTANQASGQSGSVRMRSGDVAGNFLSGGARVISGFNTNASGAAPSSSQTGLASIGSGSISGGTQGSTGIASLFTGSVPAGVTGRSGDGGIFTGNNLGTGHDLFGVQPGPSGTGTAFVRSGEANSSTAGRSGATTIGTGRALNALSGNLLLFTGSVDSSFQYPGSINNSASLLGTGNIEATTGLIVNVSSSANTGDTILKTGNTAGSGNSGDILLETGSSASGTRGDVTLSGNEIVLNPVTFVNFSNKQGKNAADPTDQQDLVNLRTLQAYLEGLKPKAAVRVGTTANVDLSTGLQASSVIDGVTLVAGDRVLVKDQATASQNGIYIVQASGAAVRATDFDSITPIDEINGAYTFISEGTTNAGKGYVVTAPVVATVGTDAINWVYFNSVANLSGGDGIDITSNVISARLLAAGGVKFVSGEIAVEASDIAGDGLVDDGSDNLAIDWATNFVIDAADAKAVKASDLASTATGKGASIIGVEDAAGYFAANNQEGVNSELFLKIKNSGVDYTVGAGGVTKGDLVFIDSDNTVLPLTTITANERCIGLALETVAAAGTVRVLADDVVLEGVLTGATSGSPYYWTGTGFSASIPTGSGANVWLVGVAKNATDLHVEVQQIKKNS